MLSNDAHDDEPVSPAEHVKDERQVSQAYRTYLRKNLRHYCAVGLADDVLDKREKSVEVYVPVQYISAQVVGKNSSSACEGDDDEK
jgi:hypothetical protein